jgi:hypothetical protein
MDSIQQTLNHFYFELPMLQHPVRLTVYLPQLVQIKLFNLEVSPGAGVEKAPRFPRNLLCLGDSITQGMEAVHPSFSYPVLLSRFLNMNLAGKEKRGAIILCGGGDGGAEKAESTAKILLKSMNANVIAKVYSLKTDEVPARDDALAIQKINELSVLLNKG